MRDPHTPAPKACSSLQTKACSSLQTKAASSPQTKAGSSDRTTACSSVQVNGIDVGADVLTRAISPCSMSACGGQCCRFGAIVDDGEIARIDGLVPRLLPLLRPEARAAIRRHRWHFRQDVRERYADPDRVYRATRVADGLCVFVLDREAGGCALHTLALEDNAPVDRYKPRECVLFPLSDVVRGEVHLHGWPGYPCTATADPSERPPAWRVLEGELRCVLGDDGYDTLMHRMEELERDGIRLEPRPHHDPAPVPRGRPPGRRADSDR